MPAVTVRNLSEATHRALRIRAAEHGRSTKAQVRAILDAAVNPVEEVGLGTFRYHIGREPGGVELDITRDKTPVECPSENMPDFVSALSSPVMAGHDGICLTLTENFSDRH